MPKKSINAIVFYRNNFAKEYITFELINRGIKVIARPNNFGQAMAIIEQQNPDLLIAEDDIEITDVFLPKLKRLNLFIRIILIVGRCEITDVIEYFTFGISGLVRTDTPISEFKSCISLVLNNETFICSAYESVLKRNHTNLSKKLGRLTPREKVILNLIGQGLTNNQLGETLNISPNSINNHRANIRKKLELKGGKSSLLQIAIKYSQNFHTDY